MLTAISFIFVFGMLVFFHELGHFLLARANKITVHEFSLGMGPKILTKQGKETLYALRLLPIGGYVRMEGEDEASEEEGSFSSKKPLNRLSVIIAGPLMNFLLAVVLFMIIFSSSGIPVNEIGSFTDNSPAIAAGLEVGDKIVSIDGEKISSWDDVTLNISNADKKIDIAIKRNNKEINKTIELMNEKDTGRKVIGIYPAITKNPIKVVLYSFSQVGHISKEILKFFAKLPFGGFTEGDVVGPVGIVNIVGKAAEIGFLNVIFVAAYISINLGIVNLLPIPALDGGRLVFIVFELLRGKPVDQEKEGFVHLVGFVILLSLMAILVFKDVKGLF